MSVVHFTQSVSLSAGSNSFAWSNTSNWVAGTLPVPGDQVVIDPGSSGVSYDDYQLPGSFLAGAIQNLTVSTSPTLEIASGISLDVRGPITNSGLIVVDPGATLASGRVVSNTLTEVGGTVALPNFLDDGTYQYEGSSADIY